MANYDKQIIELILKRNRIANNLKCEDVIKLRDEAKDFLDLVTKDIYSEDFIAECINKILSLCEDECEYEIEYQDKYLDSDDLDEVHLKFLTSHSDRIILYSKQLPKSDKNFILNLDFYADKKVDEIRKMFYLKLKNEFLDKVNMRCSIRCGICEDKDPAKFEVRMSDIIMKVKLT